MKEINLKVEGMVCGGCENRVKNALKTMPEVEEVVANHVDGTVAVTLNTDIDINTLKEKIEDLGFEVL